MLLVVLLGAAALGGAWAVDVPAVDGLQAGVEELLSPGTPAPEALPAAGSPTVAAVPDGAVVPPAPVPPPPAPAQLPPASERDYPTPGFEEALAPLGTPPVPPPAAAGSYAFSLEQTGADGLPAPVSWSPCRPIHYVTDVTGAPEGFAQQVQLVIGEVSAATGLRFIDDGLAVEAADIDRAPFQPALYGDRWAPVLVRFAGDAEVAMLAGDVAGVANPINATDPATGRAHLVTGAVYLDTTTLGWEPSPGAGPVYLDVLRHELGHLVGLGHVDDPSQTMHPSSSGVTGFQAGDLAGLAQLGHGPCAPGL